MNYRTDLFNLDSMLYCMNTRALMGLAAIKAGLELGLWDRGLFTTVAIMAWVTTVTTGPMLQVWLPKRLA